jgi:pimeloyl-ACP methyl ester carboxylesterase
MATDWRQEQVRLGGVTVDLREKGEGSPLVILHGEEVGREVLPFHDSLAEQFRVVVPSLPGVGGSEIPEWVDGVDDLAYIFLDLVEHLNLDKVNLLGSGFGGWIAAEMAVRSQSRLQKLVLAGSVGIKISAPWVRDIADLFVLSYDEWVRLTWYDPAGAKMMKAPGAPDLSHEELLETLRDRQSILMLGWRPFMHNPKLRRRLARIKVPTLVVWGESDRVVTTEYGRAYHQAIPGSKFSLIPRAGHYPHIERPGEFVNAVKEFLL